MKQIFNFLLAVSISWGAFAQPRIEKEYEREELAGRDTTASIFIIKEDGQRIDGSKVTWSKTTSMKCWVAVDDTKVKCGEYIVLQTPESYSARIRKGKWDDVTYAHRLRYGKTNLYYYNHEPLGPERNDVRGAYNVFV